MKEKDVCDGVGAKGGEVAQPGDETLEKGLVQLQQLADAREDIEHDLGLDNRSAFCHPLHVCCVCVCVCCACVVPQVSHSGRKLRKSGMSYGSERFDEQLHQ